MATPDAGYWNLTAKPLSGHACSPRGPGDNVKGEPIPHGEGAVGSLLHFGNDVPNEQDFRSDIQASEDWEQESECSMGGDTNHAKERCCRVVVTIDKPRSFKSGDHAPGEASGSLWGRVIRRD